MIPATEVVYARPNHGAMPIRVVPGAVTTYEMLTFSGDVVATYPSARKLLTALTGTPNHGLTFNRYFGPPVESLVPPGGSVLELFAPSLMPSPEVVARSKQLTVARTVKLPSNVNLGTGRTDGLGIDIVKRGHEVRKLLFAGFGRWIMASGYDPEDVLQDVFRGIVARNHGKCPFDATKASFGHYVFMICDCVLKNYHRRESRRREMEQVGMRAPVAMQEDAGASGMVDVAMAADRMLVSDASDMVSEGDALRRLGDHLKRKAARGLDVDPLEVKVAELLATGLNRREIAGQLNVSQGRVGNVITSLREHVLDWA